MRGFAAVLMLALGTSAWAQTNASLKSVDLSDMERKAAPCDNFYDFANGSWRAQNPIPASMDRWSRRWQAGEVNKDQLRKILDEISATDHPKGTPAQLTGD